MVVNRVVLTTIAFVSLTTIGSAHPGHGSNTSGDSFVHYATSSVHVLPVLFAAIVLAGIAWMCAHPPQRLEDGHSRQE